jgi:hypothetical protein
MSMAWTSTRRILGRTSEYGPTWLESDFQDIDMQFNRRLELSLTYPFVFALFIVTI